MEDHGTVDDATHWRHIEQACLDQPLHIGSISNIAAADNNIRPGFIPSINLVFGLPFECTASRKKHNILCTILDHPSSHTTSKTTSTSYKDIRCICSQKTDVVFDTGSL
jgi:hypothetical protein